MFAKLYGENDDQVLVVLESNDDGMPAVMIYFEPPDDLNLGRGHIGPVWEDNDDGWDKAERCFEKMDEQVARKTVRSAIDQMYLIVGKDGK